MKMKDGKVWDSETTNPKVWYVNPHSLRVYKGVLDRESLQVIFKSKKMYHAYNSGKCKTIPITFGSKGVFGNEEDAVFFQNALMKSVLDYYGNRLNRHFEARNYLLKSLNSWHFIPKESLKRQDVKAMLSDFFEADEEEDDR